jgi:hypothetical protein
MLLSVLVAVRSGVREVSSIPRWKKGVKTWVRLGFCPHGMPHLVTTSYGGRHIMYRFVICEIHRVEENVPS